MQNPRFPTPRLSSDEPANTDKISELQKKLYDLMVREDMFLPYLQIQISGAWRKEAYQRKYYEQARRFDFPVSVSV